MNLFIASYIPQLNYFMSLLFPVLRRGISQGVIIRRPWDTLALAATWHISACSLLPWAAGKSDKTVWFLTCLCGMDRAGSCWEGGQEGWYHGMACDGNTTVPRHQGEKMRKKTRWTSWGSELQGWGPGHQILHSSVIFL